MKNGPYELIVPPKNYPGKKYRNKYAYEHIVNWWIHYGNIPKDGYEIHHINGNHRDNNISNLKLLSKTEHRKIHGALLKKQDIKYTCGFCGKVSYRKPKNYNYRIRHNKTGVLCCSYRCSTLNYNKWLSGMVLHHHHLS